MNKKLKVVTKKHRKKRRKEKQRAKELKTTALVKEKADESGRAQARETQKPAVQEPVAETPVTPAEPPAPNPAE
jgi:hypothetical protein